MKKLLLSLFVVLGLVTLVGCQTESSTVFDFILDESYTEFMVLGTSADYAPYEWLIIDENNKTQLVGFDIELAKEIAKALGKNLRVLNRGFDFLLDDLEAGKVDFVISAVTPTAKRAEQVDFSNIYFQSQQSVVVKKTDLDKYTSIESLNVATVKVGAQLGSIQQDLTTENFGSAQNLFLQSVNDLLFNLQQGKVNAVVLESAVAKGFIANQPDYAIANFTIGNSEDGAAVAVRKGNQELVSKINEVIASLIETGKMDQYVNDAIILNS
ncbi:transporter substrate-binding domain-containing protein [Acholeplasma hippikon]|uniref:Arginine-binding extracellular protein ArtP n=1 Tax=Acholeplasma hippikon TaxID=264636 RepID=A0A449BK13_9MOLU|nr:transporter substrate-binding domain-containing protein [Acholeplasma hippikon]VEU82788.1 Arginine-binding extracellular protein ArtP precursor [Acholeplasma hippikon]